MLEIMRLHYDYQSEIHKTLGHLMHSIIQLHESNTEGWSEGNLMMLAAYLTQWKALKTQIKESVEKSLEIGIYENLYR